MMNGGSTNRSPDAETPTTSSATTQQQLSETTLASDDTVTTAKPAERAEKRKTAGIWNSESLEKLRLCRNRAYHKCTIKRRQHLHASLANYLLKEWMMFYPNSKITGKALLDVYTSHFEGKDQDAVSAKKKAKMNDRKRPSSTSTSTSSASNSTQVKIYDDHSDKQWSDLMLTNLLQCGQVAKARLMAGEKSDFATILYEEWKKIYPCSTLTTRNIKSRYTVYQKTVPDLPPPSKRRRTVSPSRHDTDDTDENDASNSVAASDVSHSPAGGASGMVCPKHSVHIFNDKDESVECFLTEQLLGIRAQLKDKFPGCDIYKPKKPKGFATAVLDEWRKFYPQSEETNKTISFKLAKYDRMPEDVNVGIKVTPKGRTVWSQTMLKHLAEARRLAIEEARRTGTLQSVGRLWREEWQKMYPDLIGDWKSTVSRYNYHFGSIDSLNPDFEDPERLLEPEQNSGAKNSSSLLNDDQSFENVKGFRTWTTKMMVDLLETKAKINASHPGIESGSSEFNKLLLKEFQKLHPKCMESSRSIYSKLQSIEREDQFKALRSSLSIAVVKVEPDDDQVVPVSSDEVCAINFDENERTENEPRRFSSAADETVIPDNVTTNDAVVVERTIKTEVDESGQSYEATAGAEVNIYPKVEPEEVKTEDVLENVEPMSSDIEGFEGWTIVMIRDFVACMDVTRKKFSQLKEKDPDGAQVKLVPLLLEGWKEIYPGTTETVKTFQTRIKHLSQQKEIIKKHLGALRLNTTKTPEKSEEPFKWHKGMIQEVIDSRKRALTIKDAELKKGHKVSFHTLWASEFKRVYPNSTFTSNNLSVHFWTWRKQQQKSASKRAKTEIPETETSTSASQSATLIPIVPKSDSNISGPIWNRASKIRLLEIGRKVEEMMRDQETPNEIKLLGFPNMIYEEWKKANPERELDPKLESSRYLNLMYSRIVRDGPGHDDEDEKCTTGWTATSKMLLLKVGQRVEEALRSQSTPDQVKLEGFANLLLTEWRKQSHPNGTGSESARSLTMMYSRLQREGLKLEDPGSDSEPRTILATWTPKHNRVLLACMEEFSNLAASAELAVYKDSVIKSWRAKFTKSSISDAMLWRKITDLSVTTTGDVQPTNLVKAEPEVIDLEEFNEDSISSSARGDIVWNAVALKNLFDSYRQAREEMSKFPPRNRPTLSDLVYTNFVKLQPNCKLAPSVLMAKFFTLKTSKQFVVNSHTTTTTTTTTSATAVTSTVATIKEEENAEKPKANVEESRKSKNLILRTWTQSMIDDMILTRKVALAKKKKRSEENPADPTPMAEIWYEEFMRLHPEYKSTKKNLWRKYKWYRSRMGQDRAVELTPKKEEKVEVVSEVKEEAKQPILRMKSIRKDVFTHLKSVLEEPRIFLPPKFPDKSVSTAVVLSGEPQFLTPPPLQTFVRPVSAIRFSGPIVTQPQSTASFVVPPPLPIPTMTSSGGQLVRPNVAFITAGSQSQMVQASLPLQQQQVHFSPAPVLPVFHNGGTWQGLAAQQLTIVPVKPVQDAATTNNDSIKLPGGATLVAVTDRNVSQLLKPKQLEKPHVTITIGDRQEAGVASVSVQQQQQPLLLPQQPQATLTAIMTTPTQQIPLTIPYPINVPQYQPRPSVVPPPPLTHLRPQALATTVVSSNQLSVRVRNRLAELNVPESLFSDLVKLYSATRDDFISTLKKGYIAFFPNMLGASWTEKFSEVSSLVTGRKLASLMDLHFEDQRKGRVASPEYLTKEPSNFIVTELLLKQIIVCYAESRNWLVHQMKIHPPFPAVYHEMCKRWPRVHPEVKMTAKQLISVHHMLNFEPGKDATPEIDCQLAEIWKIMDREVSAVPTEEPTKRLKVKAEKEEEIEYDDENISLDQLLEWFLATENLSTFKNDVSQRRARFASVRSVKMRDEDRHSLTFWNRVVNRRWLDCRHRHRRLSQIDLLHRTWRRLNPKSKLSKRLLMAACLREIKTAKKRVEDEIQLQIEEWNVECLNYCQSEENIFVLDEVEEENRRQVKKEKEEMLQIKKLEAAKAHPHQAGGFSGRLTSLSRHANLSVDDHKRDYSKDENVLAYIGEMQKTSNNKGSQPITWTPEVIRDLMKARGEARRRKRIWEDWAVKKYGGVGIAYNMPNVKFTKVDDMFREEWIKLRPEMSNLSIWTLVSYARKFDNLKKQLIEANGGKVERDVPGCSNRSTTVEPQPVKPTILMAFYPNSSIPMLDLEKVDRLKDIPQELKDLLRSRQLAKEKQLKEENCKFALNYLWQEVWREMHPNSKMTGPEIQRLLFRYEQNAVVRVRIAPALIKKSETDLGSDTPVAQPDEMLNVKPRNFVFPENEGEEDVGLTCYRNMFDSRGSVRKIFAALERDILRPNHPVFEIPLVTGKCAVSLETSEAMRRPARGYNFLERPIATLPDLAFNVDEGKYCCTRCSNFYDNVNNFVYHHQLHELPDQEMTPANDDDPMTSSDVESS